MKTLLKCPYCGKVNDLHSDPFGDRVAPADGDAGMCLGCGRMAMFDITRGLMREPTEEENEQLHNDPRVQRMLAAWRHVKGGRKQ